MSIQWSPTLVSSLAPGEVFVFGSNEGGFHGAGTAGVAFRGDPRNTWRTDPAFLAATRAPVGHPDRVGRWAVYGVGRGFQRGRLGASYAIATVTKPGAARSVSRRDIYHQLVDLWVEVEANPDLTYLVTPLGEGYAGWSESEMGEVWSYLIATHGLPANVRFVGRSK